VPGEGKTNKGRNKIMNITVIGKRWFERTNGNTYHSVKVYVDGELIGQNNFTYGYDRHYEQTALEILHAKYRELANVKWLWEVKELGHTLVNEVSDVTRKKDLA
jgi:hypothetical protein